MDNSDLVLSEKQWRLGPRRAMGKPNVMIDVGYLLMFDDASVF